MRGNAAECGVTKKILTQRHRDAELGIKKSPIHSEVESAFVLSSLRLYGSA
jgi:hypothetical protein